MSAVEQQMARMFAVALRGAVKGVREGLAKSQESYDAVKDSTEAIDRLKIESYLDGFRDAIEAFENIATQIETGQLDDELTP